MQCPEVKFLREIGISSILGTIAGAFDDVMISFEIKSAGILMSIIIACALHLQDYISHRTWCNCIASGHAWEEVF